jgi:hypothetical protein
MTRDVCPTCGSDVAIVSSDDGTSFMTSVELSTYRELDLYAEKLLRDREQLVRQIGADIKQILSSDA